MSVVVVAAAVAPDLRCHRSAEQEVIGPATLGREACQSGGAAFHAWSPELPPEPSPLLLDALRQLDTGLDVHPASGVPIHWGTRRSRVLGWPSARELGVIGWPVRRGGDARRRATLVSALDAYPAALLAGAMDLVDIVGAMYDGEESVRSAWVNAGLVVSDRDAATVDAVPYTTEEFAAEIHRAIARRLWATQVADDRRPRPRDPTVTCEDFVRSVSSAVVNARSFRAGVTSLDPATRALVTRAEQALLAGDSRGSTGRRVDSGGTPRTHPADDHGSLATTFAPDVDMLRRIERRIGGEDGVPGSDVVVEWLYTPDAEARLRRAIDAELDTDLILEHTDRGERAEFLDAVRTALKSFPAETLERVLRRVVVVHSIELHGEAVLGFFLHGHAIVATHDEPNGSTRTPLELIDSVVHESLHACLNAGVLTLPREPWAASNPPGFSYRRVPVGSASDDGAPGDEREAESAFEAGLLDWTGAQSLEEDFCQYGAAAVAQPRWLRELASRYPRVSAKWRLAAAALESAGIRVAGSREPGVGAMYESASER